MQTGSIRGATSTSQIRATLPGGGQRLIVTSPNKIGPYLLRSQIGEGGFSNIRVAVDSLGNKYACKIVPKKRLIDRNLSILIEREVNILSSLDHPSIVRFYDLIEDSLNYYLVTEFCEGETLFHFIGNRGKLEEDMARDIFRQICEAVRYIHSMNIAHRDIKPENIIINDRYEIKLLDFGLSEVCHGLCSSRCGSCSYQSPELFQDSGYDALKADMWALGVTLYTMMFAHLPWTRRSRNEIAEQIKECHFFIPLNVSDECKQVLCGLMNKDLQERFTVEQVLASDWLRAAPVRRFSDVRVKSLPRKRMSVSLLVPPLPTGEMQEVDDVKEMLKKARRKIPLAAGRMVATGRPGIASAAHCPRVRSMTIPPLQMDPVGIVHC